MFIYDPKSSRRLTSRTGNRASHELVRAAEASPGKVQVLHRQRRRDNACQQWYVLQVFVLFLVVSCVLLVCADKTILVPLTSSLYVPGKLADPENVIVDVGTEYYVKKVRF